LRNIARILRQKTVNFFLSLFEFFSDSWFTYNLRPRKSADFGCYPDPPDISNQSKIAIVMQGSVMTKWGFTFETLKMYKMMFPHTDIIVSTWCDTKAKVIEALNTLDVHVVLSEYPDNPSISHINYQIISTLAGIQRASELGAVYCLKTRTDQRMYRYDALQFLRSLLDVFPVAARFPQLKGRLIVTSLNTYKYRLYGVSDMLMFGYIEDIKLYWDIPLDGRKKYTEEEKNAGLFSLLKYSKLKFCEIYLCTFFLKQLGVKLEWTLSHSFQCYKDLFCVVDQRSIDIYWPKYNRFNEYRRVNYKSRYANELFYFSDWIRLYSCSELNAISDMENILKLNMDDEFIPVNWPK